MYPRKPPHYSVASQSTEQTSREQDALKADFFFNGKVIPFIAVQSFIRRSLAFLDITKAGISLLFHFRCPEQADALFSPLACLRHSKIEQKKKLISFYWLSAFVTQIKANENRLLGRWRHPGKVEIRRPIVRIRLPCLSPPPPSQKKKKKLRWGTIPAPVKLLQI